MSNTRASTVERNGNNSKGAKLASPWSRAIQSNAEWHDKVNLYIKLPRYRWFSHQIYSLRFFSGWISRCHLLVASSIRYFNWCYLGYNPVARFYRDRIVSKLAFGHYDTSLCNNFRQKNMITLGSWCSFFRFAAITCGIVYVYCLNFQKIDEDEYGGIWELLKEGFMTSFACFSVTWIVFFTGLHFDDVNTPLSSLWKWLDTHFVCYLNNTVNIVGISNRSIDVQRSDIAKHNRLNILSKIRSCSHFLR